MAFVYHRYPENMTGNILYPMSELMEKYPALFIARQKHHQYQPHVLEGSIPKLGCYWTDTLHFTALHPTKIAGALKKMGFSMKLKYFEIPADKLAPEKTIVFLNKPRPQFTPIKYTDFADYNQFEVDGLAHISEIATNNISKSIPTSDEFLLNYGAPYIIYKGNFNVEGAKIIEA